MNKVLVSLLLICAFTLLPIISYGQTAEDEYFYLPSERQLIDSSRYNEARTLFEKAFQEATDTRNQAKYKKNIGDTYLRSGRAETISRHLQRSLKDFRR